MSTVLVSIPVYNEERFLYETVHSLATALDESGLMYRLSIAEEGSTDGTHDEIRRLQAELPRLIVRSSPDRRGRGWALRQLWAQFDADVYAFVDADLAAGPEALIEVIKGAQKGFDVVTGSRYCPGAKVERPPLRRVVSLAYNGLVRTAFHEKIQDHQCGLKAFTRRALAVLAPLSREDTWAWDTEALLLASRLGLRIHEVPVVWTEYRSPRTPLPRLASDVLVHGRSLLRLKLRPQQGPSLASPNGSSGPDPTSVDGVRSAGTGRVLLR
jgi:glycosyltransferase involved in cell wall biosynthesis